MGKGIEELLTDAIQNVGGGGGREETTKGKNIQSREQKARESPLVPRQQEKACNHV